MFHYCYKVHYEGGFYYIGKRSSNVAPEVDRYMGSGNRCKEYKVIKKEILANYASSEEASQAEVSWIGNLWKEDPLCINERAGGMGYPGKGVPMKEEHKRKISVASKGKPKTLSTEQRQANSERAKKDIAGRNKGLKMSAQQLEFLKKREFNQAWRDKISRSNSGRVQPRLCCVMCRKELSQNTLSQHLKIKH